MSMRSKERHARLLEALNAGEIDVDDLARRFDVSASTVRRDLQHLSRNNAVRRTYGGAILSAPVVETTLEQRLAVRFETGDQALGLSSIFLSVLAIVEQPPLPLQEFLPLQPLSLVPQICTAAVPPPNEKNCSALQQNSIL
eukprot:gene38190-51575_t